MEALPRLWVLDDVTVTDPLPLLASPLLPAALPAAPKLLYTPTVPGCHPFFLPLTGDARAISRSLYACIGQREEEIDALRVRACVHTRTCVRHVYCQIRCRMNARTHARMRRIRSAPSSSSTNAADVSLYDESLSFGCLPVPPPSPSFHPHLPLFPIPRRLHFVLLVPAYRSYE